MSDSELNGLVTVIMLLVAPISIAISLLAFNAYRKFRNWRLLFLAVAFLLLAVPQTLNILIQLEDELGLSVWTVSGLYWAFFIFSTASLVPFSLLAYIYFDERRTQSIRITRPQWVIGALFLLAEVGFVLYYLGTTFNTYDFSSLNASWLAYLFYFLLTSITYVLIILIIISLFSYYRAKKKRTTLVVMMGFVCLLFSQGIGVFSYLVTNYQSPTGIGYVLVSLLQLAGFTAFLVALLRLKVFR